MSKKNLISGNGLHLNTSLMSIIVLVQLGLIAAAGGCFYLRHTAAQTYEKEKKELLSGTTQETVAREEEF